MDFSSRNWQSSIRGTVAVHQQYSNLRDWEGQETTDLVYLDRHGALTGYLRRHCIESFPSQILLDHNHQTCPIEYFLEVKSTPGNSRTRFYMSDAQYKRVCAENACDQRDDRLTVKQMETMSQSLSRGRFQVYVILRISDLLTPRVKPDIFVDPLRFKGSLLNFEAEKWYVTMR